VIKTIKRPSLVCRDGTDTALPFRSLAVAAAELPAWRHGPHGRNELYYPRRATPRQERTHARRVADRPAADLLRCLRGSGVARPRGTGEVVAPHALETAAESSRSREEAAQREASGAVVERPQQRAWVVLSTVPVVGDKDSRAVKILPGSAAPHAHAPAAERRRHQAVCPPPPHHEPGRHLRV
jgi:hypothetical protein